MAAKSLPFCFLCIFLLIARITSGEQQQSVLKVCGRGFFLSEQSKCLPCNCKGHADYCEDITGICINCKYHSMGDFCEMCEDGYILTPGLGGRHTCQPCACPLPIPSNNFAVHCDKGGATPRCKCQEGYSGNYCERCAPGYYGSPMTTGSSCKRCDCNGNTDPNLIFNECHNVTGHCQHCWGNTAGANCERCTPGFYGDAISAKDCRECECDKCGTSSCDDRTGVCHCKPGVTGRLCDQCEEGYSGFSSCQGCRRCDCGPASLRSICHPLTHSCPCRPGAGGRYCERCLPGYWNYSPSGCQKCDCESGFCDMHTGGCLAESSTVNLCNITCDQCIWHLIKDMEHSNKTLDQLKVGVLNITTGAAANDRVKYYNYTAHQLQSGYRVWRNKSSVMQAQTEELKEATDVLVLDIRELGKSESVVNILWNMLDNDTLETFTLAEQLSINLTDLNIRIEEMIHDWEVYSIQQEVDPEVVRKSSADAEGIVALMRKIDLSPGEPIATGESTEAHDLLGRIRQLEKKLMITNSRLPSVREVLSRFSGRLSEAQGFLAKADSNVHEAENKNRASVLKFQRHEEETSSRLRESQPSALRDRTPQRLEFTSEVASETLNRSVEVLQSITPISSKVEEWNNNMKNNEYSTAAYEQAVASAGAAVENLNLLVPTLLDKLKVVEDKKPVNNVTTNIMRIRELIAQARSVAKKVQVSMKFNGQSSVEVHPHSNLEELKTMTSISLFMRVDPDKDPIEDRIILYLGDRNGVKDYMGLATKNDILVFVYKLGGEDIEIPLSSKPVSQWPAVFNYVKIERLGRHGKVFLTVPSQSSTDEQKFIQKGEAPGTESLFDIDPQDLVFFVGGVPPDVKLPPPLILAPFVGCIELSSMNNDVISLYNFKQTHKINVTTSPPCPRYKLAFSQSRIASYLFDGKGYALISNIERRGTFNAVTRFDISVRTIASDGVLFVMVNEDKFFLLELKNGILRLMYDFGFSNGPKLLENNLAKLQINDAKYHEVSVIYHQSKKVILLVDKSHVKSMENPKTTLPFADIYIGGAPSSILKSRPELSSVVGLKGCVKGFQFQRKDFNLLEEPGTIGISSGCPEESFMSRKAYFSGKSYLGSTAKISPFDNFEGGLNFRTLQPSGLLFYHNEGSDEFSISLENGAVVLNNRGVKVKSHKKQYNDGRSHFLLASVNNQKYSLLVDDEDKQFKKRPTSAAGSSYDSEEKTFYYGGSPSSTSKNFTGCISYAYINRLDRDIEPEDFKKYPEKVQISLEDCPVQRPPAALLLRHRANTSGTKQSQKVTRDKSSLPPVLTELGSDDQESAEPNIKSCFLSSSPKSIHHAFRFSSIANSRQHYTDFPDSLSQRSHFSLSMKTHSSFGLIFYVSDAQEDNFMALFLAHGKLVYTFSVGDQKVKIKSEDKYNDGAWHSVIFIRDGNVGRLIVDGLTMLEDSVQGNNVSWHISSPLYVGGVPAGRAQKNIQRNSAYSFTGCIKNLQLDRKQLSSVADTFGVTPCFDGVSEGGTYFSEEGGYIVLDDSFNLGPRFELVMEVRPRVASGVLLHVHSADDYFTVYIHQGAVVVLVNDGTREFFTKVSPKQGVCSGSWHKITVIRDANVVQLDVDSEINHVVGPLSPSSTDSRKPVFIGGTPDGFLPESAATRKAFVGCMRNLTINNSQVNFSKAVLVSGAVSVGTCPAT
ncbi:laminin subunit alpha-4 [Pundamilia nyererei]|uniref:Laminin subunit alpha-4 n=1 Tax=Pundamilia nyererei TaxID=303518 RepID=A0A9Y6JJ47_9CICH|nr:PREDICTED: laminin subunit alpha-4 [Pundamilia nyererei]